MSIVVGVDAGTFIRGGRTTPLFKAVWGVVVSFKDHEKLKTEYNQLIDTLLNKNGKSRTRRVYSSYRIGTLFEDPAEAYQFREDFLCGILPFINTLDICYSYFLEGKPDEITLYDAPSSRVPHERIKPIRFIERILAQSYPHICARQYVMSRYVRESTNISIYIDNFQSEVTKSWLDLRKIENIYVLPKGDECNVAISIADICLRAINNRLYKVSGGLTPEDLDSVIPELSKPKLYTHFLSEASLYSIKPIYKTPIRLDNHLKHPIIFIQGEESEFTRSRFVQQSPLMDMISNMAYSVDGCVKSFSPERDRDYIRDGDYFVYLSGKGKEELQILRNLGYDVNIVGPNDIMRDYKMNP